MKTFVIELLDVLREYFVFLYPGAISLFLFRFANGKKFTENKISVLKMMIISYLYIIFLDIFFDFEYMDIPIYVHIIIILLASILPLVIHAVSKNRKVRKILETLGIKTSFQDSMIDTICALETDKSKGVVFKVFLDDKGIMYEGKVRLHETESDGDHKIALSGYRRYVYNQKRKKFEVKQQYENQHDRWVVIEEKDITRIEVKYEEPK